MNIFKRIKARLEKPEDDRYNEMLSHYSDEKIKKLTNLSMGVWLKGMEMQLWFLSMKCPERHQERVMDRFLAVTTALSEVRRREYEVFGERFT